MQIELHLRARSLRGLTLTTLAAAALCAHCVPEFRCDVPAKCGVLADAAPADASFGDDESNPSADRSDAGVIHPRDARHDGLPDSNIGDDCDMDVAKPSTSCAPRDELGVFVSPTGSDSGLGTRAQPLATIGRAVAVARQAGRVNIYACASAGPFRDPVRVERLERAVLYGGLDCDTWLYTPDAVTTVQTEALQVPLTIQDVTSFAAEDFAFVAADQTTRGASSIAARVSVSPGVRFTRVTFIAGAGMRGADAKEPSASNYANIGPIQLNGNDASKASSKESGAEAKECRNLCRDDLGLQVGGGKGGVTRAGGAPGVAGGDGTPSYVGQSLLAGRHGDNSSPSTGAPSTPGQPGADGPVGCGGTGATRPGRLSEQGWQPEPGADGKAGSPGQGGGGGGAPSQGGGGGGACGGCGGAAGLGGGGGGSSFALLSFKSAITLERCTLVAQSGGSGGHGGSGEVGQAGGLGGKGSDDLASSRGGEGGRGGKGGPGGGGAGGLAAAIAYVGRAPEYSAADCTLQVKGTGGAGGEPGAASPDNDAGVHAPDSGVVDADTPDTATADEASLDAGPSDAEDDAAANDAESGEDVDSGPVTPGGTPTDPEPCPPTRGIDGVAQPVLQVTGT